MRKKLVLAVLLAVAVFMPTTASAVPIVSISPVFQAGAIGDTFTVDINISGLEGESVGSFDLDIAFGNLILLGQSFALGTGLGGALDSLDLSAGFLGGTIDLAQVSLLSAANLLTLQGGGSFTLATLTFLGQANGLSPLTITQAIFADGNGNALQVGTVNGSIQVGDVTPVPEPGTMLLLGSGAVAAALRHRRQKRQLAG